MKIFLFLFVSVYCHLSWSCVLVSSDESNVPKLTSEKTLIIWDSQQQVENFIRAPQVSSNNDQVGFIVPVPNMPDVSDVSKNIFDELDQAIESKRPVKYVLGRLSKTKNVDVPQTIGAAHRDDLDNSVNIIKKFNLAQYNVLVVKSTDLDQLSKWMELNGFKMRDAVKKWIQIYVDKNFYFTVFKFKINSKQDKNNFTTYPIQISFKSDRPYYPYQEPEDNPMNPSRILNLYFLSDGYYSPVRVTSEMIGYASPVFASRIDSSDLPSLKFNLSKAYLLKWDDLTTKRPDFDLVFDRDGKITKPILLPAQIISLSDVIRKFGTTIMYSVMFLALIYIFLRKDKVYEQLFQYRSISGFSLLFLSVIWSLLLAKADGFWNEYLLFMINCNYVLILSYGVASLFRKNYKAAFFDILVFPLLVGIIVFVIFFKKII